MNGKRLLAYISGSVDQELLVRNESLATENRILWNQIHGRLQLNDSVGYQLDGTERRNFGPQSGQLVIVGEEPLLEATWTTNSQPILMLYAKPELSYDLLWSTGTSLDGAWPKGLSLSMSNLFQEITVPSGWPQQFYRARRVEP